MKRPAEILRSRESTCKTYKPMHCCERGFCSKCTEWEEQWLCAWFLSSSQMLLLGVRACLMSAGGQEIEICMNFILNETLAQNNGVLNRWTLCMSCKQGETCSQFKRHHMPLTHNSLPAKGSRLHQGPKASLKM